ncbi:MAG: transglutaminase domain-containing protein, partial [Solibacillus sp.]
MNQSKKILAAMLTIPATVIVAGQVQAEEVTSIFEIKNDFVGTSDYTSSTSSKPIEAKTKGELREKILLQMENFTKGFTVTYTGPDVVTYKKDIEDIFEGLKADLNTTTTIDTASIDYTMLYGTFNNVRVKATETKSGNSVTEVKLEFSLNYLSDSIKSKVLDGMAADLTGNTNKSILTNAKTTVQKVKAIHDYVINSSYILPSNHSVASLVLEKGGSSHAYALWTYKLLKAAGINVRYVSGMSGGELHSWNLVEVGNQWYHLDIADNDNLLNGSKDIKYRYFLANNATIGGREIYFGADGITNGKWGIAYRAFENIVNPAQANNAMYYADGASNGKIYKLDLKDENVTVTEPPNISEETSGFGKILHYKLTSADTTEIEYLYFINDAVGKYLYQYNINSRKLQLVVKEPIKSISISGDKLTYSPISGTSKWILLNQFENFNQLEADKVNKAIDELTGLDKNKVMTARQLYNALTPEQQTLVTSFYKLEEIEKKLANSDSIVEKVIEQINNLNKLNNNYIIDVGNAKLAFEDSLTTEQQLLVYNKSILFAALDEVNKVKQLNNEISKIVVDVDEPFKTIPEFIKNIESVLTKYEDLLPSLKEAIEPPQKAFMEEYSATAIQLRNELQNFINKVNIINIKSEDYLTLMRTIQDEYENKLLISQIYLLTPAQKTKVESNIKEAEKLNKQISDFNTYMATVTSGDVANIVLTTEIVADMKAADALYKSMKPAQIKAIDLAVVKKLEAIMQRIEDLVNDKDVIAVKTAIEGLNYNNYRSFDELKNAVTSADSAFIDLKDKQALLPAGIKDKLEEYKEAVKVIGAIQDRINDLNELSPRETILNVRGDLNKLNSNHKKFVDEANLIVQEKRIQDTEIAARIQQVIDAINGLSNESTYAQVKSVYDQYIALGDAKSQVTNANELITLWEKVSNDADAIIHVNNLIKALNEKSKRDQIEAAQAAYDALPESSQKQVEGYEKIAELLAKLDEMETEVADQEAARLVEEKINALNDESTPAAIKAVRDAYEALNDNAKKLVSKKMYDLLVFYENSMKEQEEQAKKEAQVIIDRINRITNSYTEAQIKDVRLAYNKLSELAKSYVTNIQKLIDAEAYILYQNTVVKEAKLQAAAFDAYMANINKNSSTAEIAKARAYYNSLSYEAKRHVKTYEKLRRLETMWNDPDYLGLIFTYYPDYIHAIKPGGIEIEKPVYDPLYIPDDSDTRGP